jgi:hypothetical protein
MQCIGQFQAVKLQKLNGLTQLLRHDQFLGLFYLLSEFKTH